MECRTINGVFSNMSGSYGQHFAKRHPFKLLCDDRELCAIVARIYQGINDEYATDSTIKDIRSGIAYCKNMMLSDDEIEEYENNVSKFSDIYSQYNEELRNRKCMDYDDQMVYAYTILKSYPQVLT